MHIDITRHEHGASGRVVEYEGDYEVEAAAIVWHATLRAAGRPERRVHGSIPLTTPALPVLADQAVRDEILKRIDAIDDAAAP